MRRKRSAGVTLMELLIAVTLLSMLSAGIVISLRVSLSAMNKADSKLMLNRRVASVERIIQQDIDGIMPVVADCRPPQSQAQPTRITFFQGEAASMRLASTNSLHEGSRGLPMILEFQVIPGENNEGVRLVINERLYTGPMGAGTTCLGVAPDPLTGVPAPRFLPIETGSSSFVLADKLSYCRFSYRQLVPPPELAKWVTRWTEPILPNAIRIEMAPLVPDISRLQPVTLTLPVRVTRPPMDPQELYEK